MVSKSMKVGMLGVKGRIAQCVAESAHGVQVRIGREKRAEMMRFYIQKTANNARLKGAKLRAALHPAKVAEATGCTTGLVNKYMGGVTGCLRVAYEVAEDKEKVQALLMGEV